MRITEGQIKQIIKECVYKILNEHQFDNVENDNIANNYENYDVVYVPDWCLDYLVNGETQGYTEEELMAMQNFENKFAGKIVNGLNIGDICVPLDGAEPSFERENSVTGREGSMCYTFFVPLK